MSKVFESISEFISFRKASLQGKSIGFVPTMGALHPGHQSLLKKSVSENNVTVLSIFVNPTQFNDANDFNKYPKTWEADLKIAQQASVDFIIGPTYEQMYPDQYRYKISESEFSKKLCGISRAGHFDGVLTVVMKLLQIVQPNKAYFGEKDFQQLRLIQDMVRAFFVPVEIVPCPILREGSGLAMSSRNERLSTEGRKKAALIFQFITGCATAEEARLKLSDHGFEIDYVQDEDGRRFAAVFLEGVRLIDNVEIK